MHANKVFADFLQRFGSVASRGSAATDQEALTRLFWFTVEFGLLREANQVKVYGSGLISSQADCANALSAACEVREFRLQDVIRQGFSTDELQRTLFVISSFDQLFQAVEDLEERLRRGRPLV